LSARASILAAKEFLAGFWIVSVKSAERAYEIAARAAGRGSRDNSVMDIVRGKRLERSDQ
jgi:hypothetical protein